MAKGTIKTIIALSAAVLAAASLVACTHTSATGTGSMASSSSTHEETETQSSAQVTSPALDIRPNVVYYGCPNSKRIEKLNLKKRRVK